MGRGRGDRGEGVNELGQRNVRKSVLDFKQKCKNSCSDNKDSKKKKTKTKTITLGLTPLNVMTKKETS